MDEMAEIQFKRNIIKRWVEVLNRVQQMKEDIKKIQYIGEYSSEGKKHSSISGISNYRLSTDSLPPKAPSASLPTINIH
jgi:hypothetical protein